MIALVIPWPLSQRGGVSTVVQQVNREWNALGIAHKIVVDDWHSATPEYKGEEIWFRIGTLSVSKGWLGLVRSVLHAPWLLWQLRRFLSVHAIEGVNLQYAGLNAAGLALLKQLGLFKGRLVLSFHGTDVRPAASAMERFLYGMIWRQADAVTTCSADLARRLVHHHPAAAARCQVAYNGVNVGLFRPAVPEDSRPPIQRRYGISVGRYMELKGHDILLQAYAALLHGTTDDLVIVGGDGPQLENSRRLAKDLGIEQRVHLMVDQPLETVAHWLRHASWCVQPSRSESFGLAVIEAAASGIPVAVSNVGGHLEIVRHGETGLIFEPESVQACAEAMHRLMVDRSAVEPMAQCAKVEVRQRFVWEGLARKLHSLLERED